MINKKRRFLLSGFAGGIVLLWYNKGFFGGVRVLDTIALLQKDIFPYTDGVPDVDDISAKKYVALILNHPRINDRDKEFLKNGVKWLNEEALELFDDVYIKLSFEKRQSVLKSIAKTSWGESFIADNLTYIFEAMFGDPVYGINKDEVGWRWLNYKTGLPRPKVAYV